jgi:hypothetical protein
MVGTQPTVYRLLNDSDLAAQATRNKKAPAACG